MSFAENTKKTWKGVFLRVPLRIWTFMCILSPICLFVVLKDLEVKSYPFITIVFIVLNLVLYESIGYFERVEFIDQKPFLLKILATVFFAGSGLAVSLVPKSLNLIDPLKINYEYIYFFTIFIICIIVVALTGTRDFTIKDNKLEEIGMEYLKSIYDEGIEYNRMGRILFSAIYIVGMLDFLKSYWNSEIPSKVSLIITKSGESLFALGALGVIALIIYPMWYLSDIKLLINKKEQ